MTCYYSPVDEAFVNEKKRIAELFPDEPFYQFQYALAEIEHRRASEVKPE